MQGGKTVSYRKKKFKQICRKIKCYDCVKMEVKVPESAELKKPHHVGRDIIEAKKSFYKLAKSRITLRSRGEHIAFEKEVFGEDWALSSAVFVLAPGTSGSKNDLEKWVVALEISINKDFFGKENKDLIPYAVEHEVFEAWMRSKRGISPQSSKINHLLARRKQLEMAMKDGKAEKLLAFYMAQAQVIRTSRPLP